MSYQELTGSEGHIFLLVLGLLSKGRILLWGLLTETVFSGLFIEMTFLFWIIAR